VNGPVVAGADEVACPVPRHTTGAAPAAPSSPGKSRRRRPRPAPRRAAAAEPQADVGMSGPTAAATLDSSVHGVVVHTTRSAPAPSRLRCGHRGSSGAEPGRRGNRTKADGSVTSRYTPGLAHLVARERGPAAGAVGGDPVALVQQATVPELADEPPHGLDVGVVERPVRVIGVDPHAGPLGEGGEVADVALHRRPAPLVEGGHAVGLDVALEVSPSSFSTSTSTGSPWQSHPPLRGTLRPRIVWNLGNRSLKARAHTWWTPGRPFAVGGPS
jgi:hypothetical protein